jgi:LuxR family quorum-sensing system transcriptional regulator CciR
MDLFDFVECSNRTRSLQALFDLLVKGAGEQGFGKAAYLALNYDEPMRLPGLQSPAIAVNFPVHWCNRYLKRRYFAVDPIVLHAPSLARPFLWDQLRERFQLEPSEQLVLQEAREVGLKRGVCVPLFGGWGRIAALSFASQFDDAEPERQMRHLNALACQFHVAFTDIAQTSAVTNPAIKLSKREKDCLSWTAEGKSACDIGMILKISDNTVNFHVKNAMRKLGTTSRTAAVIKAIRLNLIELPGRQGVAF